MKVSGVIGSRRHSAGDSELLVPVGQALGIGLSGLSRVTL